MTDQTNSVDGTPTGNESTTDDRERRTPGSTGDPQRLHRSDRDRMIGGVAGGIAETYGVDPSLVRLGIVALVLIGGVGVLLYLVAWILVPLDDAGLALDRGQPSSSRFDSAQVAGLILVLLGGVIALGQLGWGLRLDLVAAVLLIAGGIALVARSSQGGSDDSGPSPPTEPEFNVSPTPPGTQTSFGGDSSEGSEVADSADPTSGWAPARAWERSASQSDATAEAPKPRAFLSRLTIGALMLFVGVVAMLDTADVIDADPAVVAAICLTAVGAALVIGGWFGRGRGLIALGVVASILTAGLVLVDVPLRGGIGERDHRPTTAAGVADEYRLGIGQLTVDLRAIELGSDDLEISASLGIGELVIIVPRDAGLRAKGAATAGEVVILDTAENGLDVEHRFARGGNAYDNTIAIDAEVGLGSLKVLDEDSHRVLSRDDLSAPELED